MYKTLTKNLSFILFFMLFWLLSSCQIDKDEEVKEKVKQSVESYIQNVLKNHDGNYPIEHVKAHYLGLHQGVMIKNNLYWTCADFKDNEDLYDLDFYVENGSFELKKIILHRKNGKEVNLPIELK